LRAWTRFGIRKIVIHTPMISGDAAAGKLAAETLDMIGPRRPHHSSSST